jgi:hypothetical protein
MNTINTTNTINTMRGTLPFRPVWLWLTMLVCGMTNASPQAGVQEEKMATGGGAGIFLAADNEGFATQRLMLEYLPAYRHAQLFSGLRYTRHHYAQDAWSRSGQQLSFIHKRLDPATANGWQLETGLFRQGRHNLLTLDANYRTAVTPHTGLEIFINRDWVETAKALDKGVHFTFGGVALDQAVSPKFTLTGLAGVQRFSDGNTRNHGRVKLIWMIPVFVFQTMVTQW